MATSCGYLVTSGSYDHENGGWSAHATCALPPVFLSTSDCLSTAYAIARRTRTSLKSGRDVFICIPSVCGWSLRIVVIPGSVLSCL